MLGRPEKIALSFNGGKDCTVVLHLLRIYLARMEVQGKAVMLSQFKFVHFVKDGEFDEITEFRAQIESMYGI